SMPLDYAAIFQTTCTLLKFVFPLWPFMLLAPLQRRRHIAYYMTLAWFVLFGWWILTLFAVTTVRSFLVPEPWNTALFFVAGAVLIGWQVLQKVRGRQN